MTIRDGPTLGPREALPPKILKKKMVYILDLNNKN